MTVEELAAFVADLRAKVTAMLEDYATIDAASLPPNLRVELEQQVQRCRDLLALTEPEAVALHEEACLAAGRELTAAEARALLKRQ